MFPGAQFGMGSGPIYLEQLQCSDTDISLLECSTFEHVGLSTCDHSQDVGVRCTGKYNLATSENFGYSLLPF